MWGDDNLISVYVLDSGVDILQTRICTHLDCEKLSWAPWMDASRHPSISMDVSLHEVCVKHTDDLPDLESCPSQLAQSPSRVEGWQLLLDPELNGGIRLC